MGILLTVIYTYGMEPSGIMSDRFKAPKGHKGHRVAKAHRVCKGSKAHKAPKVMTVEKQSFL